MAEYVCEVVERPNEAPIMILARRERVVRCRDCAKSEKRGTKRYCKAPLGMTGYFSVCDDDFCSYGYPRVVDE